MGSEPADGGEGIFDSSGEAIFRAEAVVWGDDDCAEISSEAEAVVVEIRPSTGSDAEAAAVEVVEDGEFRGVSGEAVARAVEAEMEVEVDIEDDIGEFDGSIIIDGDVEAWFGASEDGAIIKDAEDAATLFDFEDLSDGCG